jgi:hypothetical protein
MDRGDFHLSHLPNSGQTAPPFSGRKDGVDLRIVRTFGMTGTIRCIP